MEAPTRKRNLITRSCGQFRKSKLVPAPCPLLPDSQSIKNKSSAPVALLHPRRGDLVWTRRCADLSSLASEPGEARSMPRV